MKLPQTLLFLLAFITTIHALTLPEAFDALDQSSKQLFKRKGGGGGRGGGSFSSSSGSRSSSSSSSSSSSGGVRGVGPQPRTYGTGAYYGGGAVRPYGAGQRSPGGISPFLLPAAGLAFFPGVWLYGAYAYNYPNSYTYHNNTSNMNETHPASCYCARYQDCGCDQQNDTDYINTVANNATQSRLANVNGTETLVINGTLPNGTTVATSGAMGFKQGLLETSGFWMVIAGVIYTVWF